MKICFFSTRLLDRLALLMLVSTCWVQAATLPTGFSETLVANGIPSPTAMALAPDGRVFVCQQNGRLRVIKNGVLLVAPFLQVSVDSSGERGLLGVDFDPDFAANPYVYIYYTVPGSPAHNRVSRFVANGDVAVGGSETVLLELNNLSTASNHNGGVLHFGIDGRLYIGVGDNANSANAQTLGNLLGKVLRLNSDGTIPVDNPFYNSASGINRSIWTLGLRNPFTFDIQPGTGRMFINDVGQNAREEINLGAAGANYGWPNCEGACSPINPNYTNPIHQYSHTEGCAITGGAFYDPANVQFPSSYVGHYFFADYCGGWIRDLNPFNGNAVTGFATGLSSPVDLKVGADGALYCLDRGRSGVFRIQFTASPSITTHPQGQVVEVGDPVTFTVEASGAPPLNYQWQRDGVAIPGANSSTYSIASVAQSDDGAEFRCGVANAYGSTLSNPATLTVRDNAPPTANITEPANGRLYQAGETIDFAGTASDSEDGVLGSAAYSWIMEFHHEVHDHPFLGPLDNITGGTFQIPNTGEASADVFYRIRLTVTDSGGRSGSTYVDIMPRVVTVTLKTSPTGLKVTLDGQPVITPYTVESVEGMIRTLGVITPQKLGKFKFEFTNWSDGGAATHSLVTSTFDATYTATFKRRQGQ